MSREIKFRAWDTVMGSWVPMGMNLITELVFIEKSGNSDGKFKIDTFDSESERFILEQFTGLHDKNGKEIYEGDVVRYQEESPCGDHPELDLEFNARVEWHQSCCGFGLSSICLHLKYYHDVEVIGNIHSNPELLENKS